MNFLLSHVARSVVYYFYSLFNLQTETGCCTYASRDCQDVMDSGSTESGVYPVTPEGTNVTFDVYCDLSTDGGGWLVSILELWWSTLNV